MRLLKTVLAVCVLGVAGAFAASGHWPWRRLSDPVPVAVADSAPVGVKVRDTLRRGETLGKVLTRHGVGDLNLSRLIPSLDPRRLRAGLPIQFVKQHTAAPAEEVRLRADDRRYTLRLVNGNWNAEVRPIRWTSEPLRVAGTIHTTLFDALDEADGARSLDQGARAQLAYAMSDVFAWQVDFTREIQRGDRFSVVVNREVSEEGDIRVGRIVAGELVNNGTKLSAYAFRSTDNKLSYYDAEGRSLRRAFLAAPVEFRRISSRFSGARYHPVLGRFRAHAGTDYAASTGTPVMAAGDGTVLRAGWAGGYGNLIELRHANGVTTRYGHLQRIASGIRSGKRVTQGDVIGFVGSTGLSTGPHLHYEFRVGGVPKDYQKVDKGNGAPLPNADRAAFLAERQLLDSLLHPEYAAPATASR